MALLTLLLLVFLGGLRLGAVAARPAAAPVRALACGGAGSEDWPSVLRRLFRMLDGAAHGGVLSEELARAAAPSQGGTDEGLGEEEEEEEQEEDCAPGRLALRVLLLLATPGVDLREASPLLEQGWRLLGSLGWPAVVRSGWPIFRLLRMLQRHCRADSREAAEAGLESCRDSAEPYVDLLVRHVQRRRVREGESLLASSAAYLAAAGGGGCPLSSAAAFLAGAWLRYPVYDAETEDLLGLAQSLVEPLALEELLATRHPLLDMLSDVAATYQAFLIDSGALYVDLRPKDAGGAPAVDYTRHMMSDPAPRAPGASGACPVPSARTPLGRCNAFAPLGPGLSPWRRRGVAPGDTARALQATWGRPAALFQLLGPELRVLPLPGAGGAEVTDCLARALLSVLAKAPLPDFEIVVNYGDRPLQPRAAGREGSSDSQAERSEPAAPLFSLCAAGDFWDVPLPRLCGVRCSGTEGGGDPRGWLALTPVPTWSKAGDEAVDCYLARLLEAFAETLRYEPSRWRFPELEAGAAAGGRRLPPTPTRRSADAFAARCAAMLEEAAQ